MAKSVTVPNEIYRTDYGTLVMIQEEQACVYNECADLWISASLVKPEMVRELYQLVGKNLRLHSMAGYVSQ